MQLGHAAPSRTRGEESVRGETDFWVNFWTEKRMAPIFDPKSSVNSQRVCSDRHRPQDKTTSLDTIPPNQRAAPQWDRGRRLQKYTFTWHGCQVCINEGKGILC